MKKAGSLAQNRWVKIALLTLVFLLEKNLAYPESRNVYLGVRISFRITDSQAQFVNKHFDYVMTPFLGWKIREAVKGPKLLLYRSIRGTREGFHQFDWRHINSCENMFLHRNGQRIKTIYNSWLMNGADLVSRDSIDALNHWINYYAVTASEQVYRFDYDGLFIDSAGNRLGRGEVRGDMPDGYSASSWREARYRGLRFIKQYLPDKLVIFNGLHSDNGAERNLLVTDGGMWETFAFHPASGRYLGKDRWEETIKIAKEYSRTKFISIVSKKRGFTKDAGLRMFIFASYLLVSSPRVVLYISDLDYGTRCILYYPEYQINLGRPQGEYFEKGGIYGRYFQKGLVLVNPDEFAERSFLLREAYQQIVPLGGGKVREDGSWEGKITYRGVNRRLVLPPLSGFVLKKQPF